MSAPNDGETRREPPAPSAAPAMSRERWEAIDRVVQAALALPTDDRRAFVDAACRDQPALRTEVDSLLAAIVAPGGTADVLGALARDAWALGGAGGSGADARGRAASHASSGDDRGAVARLAAALSERYAVEREIGRGGMATVWLARDLRHARPVALKVLDATLGALVGPSRFRREIETAARLSHPHVLPLFDSGEAAGSLYYVMPYVAGGSLRDRLRGGPLATREAMRIVRDVADALDHAHRHGVVHRDVKPANILLDEGGRALVADFGIARALHDAGGAASRDGAHGDGRSAPLTATGTVVGTPGYMSPEQRRGDAAIDARTDVYALGCVAHELLAGAPPFAPGARPLPAAIGRVVRRAVAERPADRYATAGALAEALDAAVRAVEPARRRRRAAVAMLGMAALAAGGWWTWNATAAPSRVDAGARSLAVLPCATRAVDSTRAFIGDGVTQELIAEASRSRAFDKVIAHSSTVRYRGAAKSPAQVGAELGADVLLYCDYEQSTSRERLRAEAVRAADGALLWTEVAEREVGAAGGAVALPGRLVASLVGAVGGGARAADRPGRPIGSTDDLQALNLYKEGRFHLEQIREDAVQRSILLFRQALARDSTFALPYVGLARAYLLLGGGHGTMHEREAFPLVREMAARALALDDRVAEAHWLLGMYEMQFAWNWGEAERRLRRAIALDPNAAGAYQTLGWYLAHVGRYREAFAAIDRAAELNPVDPSVWGDAGVTRYLARRYAEAVPLVEKGLAFAPDFHPDHFVLGAVYAEMGDLARALPHLRLADSLSGRGPVFRGHLAYGYALAGDTAAARAILRELEATTARPRLGKSAAAAAQVHIALGEPDSAFAWLEVAYAERAAHLVVLLPSPVGARLASDPRYAALMRRVGLSLPPGVASRR